MIKKGVIFLILLFFPMFTYAGIFGLEIPPGIAPGAVCLKTGCNMTGDIYMNNNVIYNATFINGTISSNIDASNILNPFWVERAGDTMSGNLNMGGNDILDIGNLYASKYYSGDWSNVTIYEAQILDLTHTVDTHVAGNGVYLTNDSTTMYFSETKLNNTIDEKLSGFVINASQVSGDIWVNETGDSMTGNLNMSGNNITDVYYLGFDNNESYFRLYTNGTNTTLQLWVNGALQQDWGASTTIYQEATFLDSIFGDGSTLLNVCLPDGVTVNGQPCNATSVFNVDEIWINNINGNATFNETKLNSTIDNKLNGSHSVGAGNYLYNVYNDSTYIYANMSAFNATMDERDDDYCSGGVCGPLNITGPINLWGDMFMNGTLNVTNIYADNLDVVNLTAEQINAINIVADTVEAINMTTERLTASIIWADYATIVNMTVENLNASKIFTEEFVVNGSVTGLCQTNGTGCNYTVDTRIEGVGPYLSNDSTYMYFDEGVLNSTIDEKIAATTAIYRADSCSVVVGTLDGGDVNSTHFIDNQLYNVSETATTPGFDIRCNYTVGVNDFNGVALYQYYDGHQSHSIHIELWNYNTFIWDSFGTFTDEGGFIYIIKVVPDYSSYVSGGLVQARLNHDDTGTPFHNIFIDYFVLVYASGGVSSGLSGSGTAGYVPLWIDSTSLGSSNMYQNNETIIVDGDLLANNLCYTNGSNCQSSFLEHSVGAGDLLYNEFDGNKTNIYINETALNSFIDNRTGIFELNFTVNVISSVGNNASIFDFPRLSEILEVTVTPTTSTNKYRVHINGSVTGTVIDQNRIPHVGEWSVAHRGSLIQSETVSAYITEATIDELFVIKLRYRQ